MLSMQEFREAFKLSLPVLGAYWFLGVAYGLLAAGWGYPLWVPVSMAMFIYSGSVEFLALTMLAGAFNPVASFMVAFIVGARHLFYGISMLDRFRGAGWRKPLLIYLMSDETFAVNYSQGGSFNRQLMVSVLDYLYWLTGGIMGYVLASLMGAEVMQSLGGLDFAVTAMFVAIFMDDYLRNAGTRSSAWLGILATALCLAVFGSDDFIIPSMCCILMVLYWKYRKGDVTDTGKETERITKKGNG